MCDDTKECQFELPIQKAFGMRNKKLINKYKLKLVWHEKSNIKRLRDILEYRNIPTSVVLLGAFTTF